MAFPPQFLDELRGRLSLASVIGRRVRLTRRGREYTGLCPFHNEKTPSFTVNEEKGFFHCFGCGAHGDVVGFEMRAANLSFPEAVERLAAEAGVVPPQESREERERSRRQASLYDVVEAACAWFERQLRQPVGRAALAYLQGRGLDDESIARFRLGFAPDGRSGLAEALRAQGIPRELVLEAGLLIDPDRGDPYDRFRGRVMFPIGDRRGRLIAFGGRIMGEGQPKYLNSPETPLFHKGAVLYGHSLARSGAADGLLAVVEGYMDVIAMLRAEIPAVAPLGTALTERQLEELWRLVPEPVLCFDGDAAGQRAAARAVERALPLLRPGHSLRFAVLPPSEDPDTLIAGKGPAAMRAILDGAEPLVDVLWRLGVSGRRVDTPERRAALDRHFEDAVQRIADRSVQQHYRQALRERLWESFRAARPGRRGATGPRASGRAAPPPPPPARDGLPVDALRERILLAVLVNHPSLLERVEERLGGLRFSDNDLDNLRQEILKHLHSAAPLDSVVLRRYLVASGFARLLASLLGPGTYVHAPFARSAVADETALAGWEHAYSLYMQKDLKADIDRAEQRLASEMSDESYSFFQALKNQEQDDDDEREVPG
ncbi:MAG: DNA primase [Rhodospirillales bacterium]|nr:DNA primase [Rhodospirillales bacterium]